jgi:hypothetical protein
MSTSKCPVRLSSTERELAEQAIAALRKLQRINPFVAAAVRGYVADEDFVLVPTTTRDAMQTIRCITEGLQIRAVHKGAGISQERTEAAIAALHGEVH